MTSVLARYSAILSALLALLGTAVWIAHGAPDIPALTPNWHTVATNFLADLDGNAAWASRTALVIISPSVMLSAMLSLFLLLRGSDTADIRHLGIGLGWWSGAFFYMVLLPALPGAMSWGLPLWILLCADAVTMTMVVAATHAFVQFWANYPRPVTGEDVSAFMMQKVRRDLASLRPWRRWWMERLTHKHEGDWIEYQVRYFGAYNRAIWTRYLRPGPLITLAALAMAAGVGLLWRAESYIHDRDLADGFSFAPFLFLLIVFMIPWANLWNIFSLHRATGTEDERRKIEWVWVSFWIAFVLFFAGAILGMAPLLYGAFFGGYGLAPSMVFSTIILQFMPPLLAPLLFLLALIASIFYRGDVDPKLALRGVTLWAVLGVLLTLVFALVERSVAVKLSFMLGLPPQTGFVAAGAIVAATFQPIRKVSEKQVNRFVERVLPASALASGTRRTAAVAVVDISGYTALSARDEQSALVASALVQKEAKRLADVHDGRVVKSTGDGVIMCFEDAGKALLAVRELHVAVAKGAGALSIDMKLHSGLNWGEIVEMHDGDIYGQTVNLTARIADWAKAGEIGASEGFCAQLGSGSGFEAMGPQSFKNVPQPVACLKLAGA